MEALVTVFLPQFSGQDSKTIIDVRGNCEISATIRGLKDAGVGFPGGAVVENLPANAEDTGSSPGLGSSHMPRSG